MPQNINSAGSVYFEAGGSQKRKVDSNDYDMLVSFMLLTYKVICSNSTLLIGAIVLLCYNPFTLKWQVTFGKMAASQILQRLYI